MPLYEYQCDNCGKTVEIIQKFSDGPPAECPSCGGEVQRLLSAPAIQFKGSGWYINDYARKNAHSERPSEGDAASAKDGKTGTKSDGAGNIPAKSGAKNNTSSDTTK